LHTKEKYNALSPPSPSAQRLPPCDGRSESCGGGFSLPLHSVPARSQSFSLAWRRRLRPLPVIVRRLLQLRRRFGRHGAIAGQSGDRFGALHIRSTAINARGAVIASPPCRDSSVVRRFRSLPQNNSRSSRAALIRLRVSKGAFWLRRRSTEVRDFMYAS